MAVNPKLIAALNAACIDYTIDGNEVVTPYGTVYDMQEPFRSQERYEFVDGGVCTSADEVIEELESTNAYEEEHAEGEAK